MAVLSGADSLKDDLQHSSWRHNRMEEEEGEEFDGIRSNHSQTESDLLNPRGVYNGCHLECGKDKVASVEEDER